LELFDAPDSQEYLRLGDESKQITEKEWYFALRQNSRAVPAPVADTGAV
jgi:hypothetical protein